MYHQTPKVEGYVAWILKYRVLILALFVMTALATLLLYHPKVHSNDTMFWLKDAKEFKKTRKKSYETFFLSKLTIEVDVFDDKSKETLQEIQNRLLALKGVKRVQSLFSHNIVKRDKESESSMPGIVNVASMDSYKIKAFAQTLSNPYGQYVENDFHTFHYFITATEPLNIGALKLTQKYHYDDVDDTIAWYSYALYGLLTIVMLVLLFKMIFSNYISSLTAMLVVTITTLLTFTLIGLLTGTKDIYVVMPFITLSITLVDYMFFYYRWHVSQYKIDTKSALAKMLNRNITPALWTSFLTLLGLGGLLFVNLEIIRLLSLSLIVSSVIGYLVNITFLPAFLSYFHIEHAHVNYAKRCYIFASSELHYNKKFLVSFLTLTLFLLVFGAYNVYTKSSHLFELHVNNDQLAVVVPYEKIDLNLIETLDRFSEDIREAFPESIDEVNSLSTKVKEFNEGNAQTKALDTQALEQALFYLDLYGMGEEYYDEGTVNIRVDVFDIDKNKLIAWLQKYEALDIYFVDKGTLLNSAMYEKTLLLSLSLFTALLIIGAITGWIFRTFSMAFVGFMVNAIPIVWFGFIVNLLEIPLNLEMLIAMSISLGLASDATIHFAFKYFKSRYIGRSQKHSLEKMFFYAGVPVIIGSVILIAILTLFGFSQITALQHIGQFSALLILLSLLTDIFILPVTLLHLDKFGKGVKNQ